MGEDKVVERSSDEILAKMKVVHDRATALLDSIIELFGSGAIPGRASYCRGLAVENLEATMHRCNDGTQWLLQNTPDIREKMAEEALKKSAVPGLQIVDGGK